MKPKTIAPLVALLLLMAAQAADGRDACGRLVGASGTDQPGGGFRLRGGEPVDFVSGGKTVHGVLQVFVDGSAYRAYWKPDGGTNSMCSRMPLQTARA